MISINRTQPSPAKLSKNGSRQTKLDCAAYDLSPQAYREGRSTFPNKTYYNWRDVKDVLMRVHHGKCCYCEVKRYDRGDLQVEHFRPKGAVRQFGNGAIEHPGYYWLAYTWDNLLLACPPCNRSKGVTFPLMNPHQRARSHHDDTNKELVALVNPTEENPRDHVRFLDDAPYPLTERGRQTINEIKLHRADLTEERKWYIGLLWSHILILKSELVVDLHGYREEAARTLKKALQEAEPFSAMVSDLIAEIDGSLVQQIEQSVY